MEMMSKALNGVWQGYLRAASWVATHPHRTIWLVLAAIIAALVL